MDKSGETTKYGAVLLRHARVLYQNIAAELARSLDALREGREDPGAKERTEMIRAHRKALQMVLEFEQDFAKREREEATDDGLDLEAAREEVYRRLDRLTAAK